MNKIYFCVPLIYVAYVTTIVSAIQNFYWRDYSHRYVPPDALEVGIGKYIGQVYDTRGLLPATIYRHRSVAVSIYGNSDEHIKILCTTQPNKFYWSRVSFNNSKVSVMRNVVKGGFKDDYDLFIGTVDYKGDHEIGQVISVENYKLKGLHVLDADGKRHRILNFYLLKYNSTTASLMRYTKNDDVY